MTFALRTTLLAGLATVSFALAPAFADDAMTPKAMATDAMATDAMHTDAMAPMMSDDDLKLCLEQAGMISFETVMKTAVMACQSLHDGEAAGGAMMGGDAMATDAMAPAKK